MLKHWNSHAEYQHFISETVSHLNESQLIKLNSYKDSLDKLTSLNLDTVGEFLKPFYSNTGRPALHQAQRYFPLYKTLQTQRKKAILALFSLKTLRNCIAKFGIV